VFVFVFEIDRHERRNSSRSCRSFVIANCQHALADPSEVVWKQKAFGSASGAGVTNIFVGAPPGGVINSSLAPALTNNVITGGVASASSAKDATSFANSGNTQGDKPSAAYASGATLANLTSGNNVDLATLTRGLSVA
jgi:hypothetical protein